MSYVTDFDFNLEGTRSVAIDNSGMCLISEIDCGSNCFHLNLGNSHSGDIKSTIFELAVMSFFLIHFDLTFNCKYSFLTPEIESAPNNRCRWSTTISDPSIFLKYRHKFLNILDSEKTSLILKDPIQLERDGRN